MRRISILPRILAVLLSLALALPNPAFALRTENSQQSPKVRVGLEEALQSGDPDKLPKLASAALVPTPDPSIPTPTLNAQKLPRTAAAGAEEVGRMYAWAMGILAGAVLAHALWGPEMELSAQAPMSAESGLPGDDPKVVPKSLADIEEVLKKVKSGKEDPAFGQRLISRIAYETLFHKMSKIEELDKVFETRGLFRDEKGKRISAATARDVERILEKAIAASKAIGAPDRMKEKDSWLTWLYWTELVPPLLEMERTLEGGKHSKDQILSRFGATAIRLRELPAPDPTPPGAGSDTETPGGLMQRLLVDIYRASPALHAKLNELKGLDGLKEDMSKGKVSLAEAALRFRKMRGVLMIIEAEKAYQENLPFSLNMRVTPVIQREAEKIAGKQSTKAADLYDLGRDLVASQGKLARSTPTQVSDLLAQVLFTVRAPAYSGKGVRSVTGKAVEVQDSISADAVMRGHYIPLLQKLREEAAKGTKETRAYVRHHLADVFEQSPPLMRFIEDHNLVVQPGTFEEFRRLRAEVWELHSKGSEKKAGVEEDEIARAAKMEKRFQKGESLGWNAVMALIGDYYREVLSPVSEREFKLFFKKAQQVYSGAARGLFGYMLPALREAESQQSDGAVAMEFRYRFQILQWAFGTSSGEQKPSPRDALGMLDWLTTLTLLGKDYHMQLDEDKVIPFSRDVVKNALSALSWADLEKLTDSFEVLQKLRDGWWWDLSGDTFLDTTQLEILRQWLRLMRENGSRNAIRLLRNVLDGISYQDDGRGDEIAAASIEVVRALAAFGGPGVADLKAYLDPRNRVVWNALPYEARFEIARISLEFKSANAEMKWLVQILKGRNEDIDPLRIHPLLMERLMTVAAEPGAVQNLSDPLPQELGVPPGMDWGMVARFGQAWEKLKETPSYWELSLGAKAALRWKLLRSSRNLSSAELETRGLVGVKRLLQLEGLDRALGFPSVGTELHLPVQTEQEAALLSSSAAVLADGIPHSMIPAHRETSRQLDLRVLPAYPSAFRELLRYFLEMDALEKVRTVGAHYSLGLDLKKNLAWLTLALFYGDLLHPWLPTPGEQDVGFPGVWTYRGQTLDLRKGGVTDQRQSNLHLRPLRVLELVSLGKGESILQPLEIFPADLERLSWLAAASRPGLSNPMAASFKKFRKNWEKWLDDFKQLDLTDAVHRAETAITASSGQGVSHELDEASRRIYQALYGTDPAEVARRDPPDLTRDEMGHADSQRKALARIIEEAVEEAKAASMPGPGVREAIEGFLRGTLSSEEASKVLALAVFSQSISLGSPEQAQVIQLLSALDPQQARKVREALSSDSDPTTAGTEEEALSKAMANPEVSAGLEQQGWAEVPGGFVAEADLSAAASLVLQKGLKQPEGLPKSVPVIWADETTVVGMLHYLSGSALQGGYNVAFSTEHFDLKDAQAAVPLSQPMPGSVLLAPGIKIRANELGAAFVISKRTGTIYVIGIVEFTSPNWKKPLLYLRVQA